MSEIKEVKELLIVLHSKIDGLEEKMDSKFNEVYSKFNEVDSRFDKVDSKFNEVYKKIDKVQFYLEKEIAGSLKIALNEQDELAEQINAIGEQGEKTENNINKFKSSFLDMTMEGKLKVVPA